MMGNQVDEKANLEHAPATEDSVASGSSYGGAYSWYVVGVLMVAFTVSLIDRHILALLVEPIRRDLSISDTQFSLLVGFAFALFYTIVGLPIARMADRKNRRMIIIIGIAIWSVMTALSGVAKNFWHLFLTRVGLGVGEAALSPAAYSIISDYFPREKLGRAISVYAMGVYLGAGMSMVAGSTFVRVIGDMPPLELPIIGTTYAWQLTFFAVSVPAFLLIPLMLTVREPVRRGLALHGGKAPSQAPPVKEVVGFMRTNASTLVAVVVGFAFAGVCTIGVMAWTPEMFRRTYAWNIADAGLLFGVFLMVFGSMGVYAGGLLSDWLTRRGYKDAVMRAAAISIVINIPFAFAMPLMPTAGLAVLMLAFLVFSCALTQGLSPTILQLITPNQMRAQVMASYFFFANIFAIGLGPSLYAMMTDYVFGYDESLRYSLAIVSGGALFFSLGLLMFGLRHYRASLMRADAWSK